MEQAPADGRRLNFLHAPAVILQRLRLLSSAVIIGLLACPVCVHSVEVEICGKLREQGRSAASLKGCGLRWAVKNMVTVKEFWEVQEVKFYWDSACNVQVPFKAGEAFQSSVMSTMPTNIGENAFDNDLSTRWSANCRVLMGGCAYMKEHVGIDTVGFLPVNLDPTQQYANVRCTKIYQTINATRQAHSIALVTWHNETTDEGYHVVAGYRDLLGGNWQKRPAMDLQLWRLWNDATTPAPWTVAEFMFYTDAFCTKQAHGVVISSQSFWPILCIDSKVCDEFVAQNTQDGIMIDGRPFPEPLPTVWKANCNQWKGCEDRRVAWIGLDFGQTPVRIRCIRIYQPTPFRWPLVPTTHSSSLLMQYWDGYEWVDNEIYHGMTHGVWNDTRPVSKSAWKLSNYDPVREGWVVHELGLYEETDCGAPLPSGRKKEPIPGLSIDSNPALTVDEQYLECRKTQGSCADLAFDTKTETSWKSSCTACGQHDAWLGMMYRSPKGQEIRCFRLMQGSELKHSTDSVQLSYWDGTQWKRHRLEVAMAAGVWNVRPAAVRGMWRLFGISSTALPWTLVGFKLYSDSHCNIKLDGTQLACGSHMSYPVADAFDDDNQTQWEASCVPPRRGEPGCAAGSAWIGMQSDLGEFSVRCVAVQQHRHRDRQVSRAQMQIWDGVGFIPSSQYTRFDEMGGGAWQHFPGSAGSMWRFTAQPRSGGLGFGVSEMSLFSLPACSGKALPVGWPNIIPICSAFASGREVAEATGHTDHLMTIGDWGMAIPDLAFDGDPSSFWADITSTSQSWIGLDFVSQVADVQCVQFSMPAVASLQASYAEIQVWDGHDWITRAKGSSSWRSLPLPASVPGGIGFQRRPIAARTMWRLQSEVAAASWEVIELEFYPYGDCSGDVLTGVAISSIPKSRLEGVMLPDGGQTAPQSAFDGNVGTRWCALCPQGGCSPGDAWIGLDMMAPKKVSCFRIMQTGRRDYTAEKLALSTWDGTDWTIQDSYNGIGGDTWNMRPAAADSMWRITFVEYMPVLCPEHGRGMFPRGWGISELEFYSDDDCKNKLSGISDGATVIASGVREPDPKYRMSSSAFAPQNAFDGKTNSFWVAQCGNKPGSDDAPCQDGKEWIGLDFSQVDESPRDVRCVRLHQNRASQRECCDPAEKIRLERWNGTNWMTMEWRHVPVDDEPPMQIPGVFGNLGVCKSEGADYWEERRRRQTEQCVLPQSTAVRLLSDPLCDKHDACADARFTGECCPLNADLAISRCCCDFLMRGRVFEDEFEKDVDRTIIGIFPILGLEHAVIRSAIVLPFVGVILAIICFIMANIREPRRRGCCRYRSWAALCKPLQDWLRGVEVNWDDGTRTYEPSYVASFVGWFVIWKGGRRAFIKFVLWLAFSFVMGGAGFWLMISYMIAEVFIKLTVLMSLVINFAKSPYKPRDPMDLRRMDAMKIAGLKTVTNELSFGGIGHFCAQFAAGVVMFCTYVCRAAFDFVLMRFSLMALQLVDTGLSVPQILYHFPTFNVDIEDATNLMYDFVGVSGTGFQETFRWLFMGVPTCEGPVILFSGMWLAGVTMLLIRWLNYDFFGIFMATKQCVALTRPTFQKSIGLGVIQGFQGGLFLFMQCIMLIFTRALKLVNPLDESNQKWTCPFEDQFLSILVGRTFLVVSAVIALIVTFLCANGHFMGQDYIVGEFSRFVGMDLRKLDPDGADGLLRFDHLLAMIPTTFGIWLDWWNVDGFLIEERARVYASELHMPVECAVCGEPHAPYHEVMRATGMQLSLAYQLLPAGALVGKACEYLNNPPLFYWGKKLKCYHGRRYMQYSLQGVPKKLHCSQSLIVWSGLFLAFCIERLLPFFVRIAGGAIYVVLVYYTITIDSNNVATDAKEGFTLVVLIALGKAVLEYVLPPLLLIALEVLLHMGPGDHRVDPNKAKQQPARRPIIGQVFNGVFAGASVFIYLITEDPWDLEWKYAALIGVVGGIFLSIFAVSMASVVEACPDSRFTGTLFLVSYEMVIATGTSWLLTTNYSRVMRFVIGTAVCVVLVGLAGFAFKPAQSHHGRLLEPSSVLPLLVTHRALCGPIGTGVGIFCAANVYEPFKNISWLGDIGGVGACVGLGILVGLCFALAADKIIHTRAAQIALPWGATVAVLVGIFWHWGPAAALGGVLTICIGAVVEHRVVKKMTKQTILIAEIEQRLGRPMSADGKGLPTLCASTSQNTLADLPSDSKDLTDLTQYGNGGDLSPSSKYGNSRPISPSSKYSNGRDFSPSSRQENKPLRALQDNQEPREVWVRPQPHGKKTKKYTLRSSTASTGESWTVPRSRSTGRGSLPALENADRSSRHMQRTASASELRALTNLVDASPRRVQGPTVVSASPPPSR